jgi:hypothetical protein
MLFGDFKMIFGDFKMLFGDFKMLIGDSKMLATNPKLFPTHPKIILDIFKYVNIEHLEHLITIDTMEIRNNHDVL